MRRIVISLSFIFAFILSVFIGAWVTFLTTPLVSNPNGFRYQLRPGTSVKALAADLHHQGLVRYPFLFSLLARLRGDAHTLKAGVYLIPQGATPSRLLDQVTSGKGLLYRSFMIIPGWNFQQLRAALQLDRGFQHTLDAKTEIDIMAQLGSPGLSPEGEFFPDTYYYEEGSSDLQLLSRAKKRMQIKAEEAWQQREKGLPYKTVYEVLIAASLVEKEAHVKLERPMIAAVLMNRLRQQMLLQFDPTVIYGLYQLNPILNADFKGVIRKQDLQMDTPYNTYLHKGLPPTPIALPSMDAIQAVLHPVQQGYLYFVANGGGGHQFSKTLYEHNVAVMLQRYREQGFFNGMRNKSYLLKRFSLDNI